MRRLPGDIQRVQFSKTKRTPAEFSFKMRKRKPLFLLGQCSQLRLWKNYPRIISPDPSINQASRESRLYLSKDDFDEGRFDDSLKLFASIQEFRECFRKYLTHSSTTTVAARLRFLNLWKKIAFEDSPESAPSIIPANTGSFKRVRSITCNGRCTRSSPIIVTHVSSSPGEKLLHSLVDSIVHSNPIWMAMARTPAKGPQSDTS